MSVKSLEPSQPDHIGKAIRKYRNDIGLTQAQLAVALGLSPTSIYRYEAGTSPPDLMTLQRLYRHSSGQGNDEAKRTFYNALSEKVDINPEMWNPETDKHLPSLKHAQVAGRRISPSEQLYLTALVLMLRNSIDESSHKMMQVILEPWMKAAKAEVTEK